MKPHLQFGVHKLAVIFTIIAVAFSSQAQTCSPDPAGLVGWWGGEGTVADSISGNNGVLKNGATFGPGKVGQAFSFDGFSGYVEIPSSPLYNPPGSFSMEVWVYPFPQNAGRIIMGKWSEQGDYAGDRSYNVYLNGNNAVGFAIADAANQVNGAFQTFEATSSPVPNNAWSHLVLTYEHATGTRKIFINGALVATRTDQPITVVNANTKFAIGARMTTSTSATDFFAGRIDEPSFYLRAISADEVQAIYAAGSLGKCPPPAGPSIALQPQDAAVDAGAGASLSVLAVGLSPLSYQWQFNGGILVGATNATLIIPSTQPSDSGAYTVVVTNSSGSIISSPAILVVNSFPPTITTQPFGATVNAGASVNFSVGATGNAPLSYQWQLGGVNLAGATSATLTLPNVQLTNAGVYSVVVSNLWGLIVSSNAVLAVNVFPPSLTSQPISQVVNAGSSVQFSSIATGTAPLAYQWQLGGSNIARATSTRLSLVNVQPTNAGVYTLVVTNAYGSIVSSNATLTVNVYPPAITAQPVGQTVNVGASVVFSGSASGTAPLAYQWQFGGLNIAGATNSQLLLVNVQPTNAGLYSYTVTNPYGMATSSNAALVVNVFPPVLGMQPKSQFAYISQNVTFSVSASGTAPLSYLWYFNGTNLLNNGTPTLNLTNVQLAAAGNYWVTVSNAYGTATTTNAVLTINPPSCASITNGLIAWWAAEGNASDSVGHNNGTLLNGAGFAPGKVGQAFEFDGYSKYVEVPSDPSLNPPGSFTLEAWVYPYPQAGGRIIMGKWSNLGDYSEERSYNMYLAANNAVGFAIADAAHQEDGVFQSLESGSTPVPLSAWSHIVNVYNQTTGTRSIYINGSLAATRTDAPITVLNATTKFAIGARLQTSTQPVDFFAGRIDEASVYNRALSVGEIQALYYAGTLGKCAPTYPPAITSQPQGATANAGDNATFAVVATGTAPLAFQWQLGGVNLAGATSSSLNLLNVQPADAGPYSVIVSNQWGIVTSSNATLTVNVFPPTITTQPVNVTVDAGSSVVFHVAATGTSPLSYQWQLGGVPIPGAISPTLSLNNVQSGNAGVYSVLVTNLYGMVTSSNATLVVSTYPPVLGLQPVSQSILVGDAVQLLASATGTTPLAYQWFFNGAAVVGATTPLLSFTNAQLAAAGLYSVVVTNLYGSVTSSNATLSVNDPVCVSITNGLVSWWEAEGDAADSASAYNGLLKGGAGFASGKVGQAFNLNGTSAYVEVPSRPQFNPPGSFSLEAWVYPLPRTGGRIIMGKWSNIGDYADERSYNMYLSPGNTVGFSISDAAHQQDIAFHTFEASASPLPFSTWTHIVNVYDQTTGTRRIYLNGVLAASRVDAPITVLSASTKFAIGARLQDSIGPVDFFAGRIDEASFYNRALTDAEIHSIYRAGSQGKCQPQNPPTITSQPLSQTVPTWTNVSFAISASGTAPLAYQWQFGSNILANATNAVLSLPNVTVADAGVYSVTVTNLYGAVTSSNAVLTVLAPPSLVQVSSVTATSAVVVVPVTLLARGTENGVGFSLNFNPTNLTFAGITAGSGVSTNASVFFNTNAASLGRLGVLLALAGTTTFPAGTQEVADVSFFVNSGTNPVTAAISFGDAPTARQVSDALANPLPSAFVPGTVTIPWLGYEGDVAPLPNGDSAVTLIDWVQVGRFVAGLDTITNASEFQRADCAPRATFGDGQLTVADWVQAGRYAAGLDALTVAGGPVVDVNGPLGFKQPAGLDFGPADSGRILKVMNAAALPSQTCQVAVQLTALGNENAVGFSLQTDPAQVLLTSVTLGGGDSGANLIVNTNRTATNGVVAVLLSLPPGTVFSAGTYEVARLNFTLLPTASNSTNILFTNRPTVSQVTDANANALSTTYQNGVIVVGTLTAPTLRATASPTGLVLTWPVNALGYTVQTSTELGSGTWTTVSATPSANGADQSVTLPVTPGTQRYYRLFHP